MTAILIITTALLANVVGALMAFPQAWKLFRTRRLEGVSPAWAGVSVAMNLWWVLYGVATGRWAVVPVAAIAALLYGSIAGLFGRHGGRVLSEVGVALGIALVAPLPLLVFAGWTATGVALGLGYGVQMLPAVLSAYRSSDLSGVAAGTWLSAAVEGALWVLYAALVRDLAIAFGGAAGLVMGGLILVRLGVKGYLGTSRALAAT